MNNSLLHQFINEHVKQSLTENLLTEQVFGKQAFVYHGSRSLPSTLLPELLADTFTPGSGDMYGKGLYTVYSPDPKQQTFNGSYGDYVYKLKVNLHGFIIFDADVCQKVYGSNLSPVEQLELLDEAETLKELKSQSHTSFDAKDLSRKLDRPGSMTSARALKYHKILSKYVKGIIFTGKQDGQVAVIYDPASVVPAAWKQVTDKSWTRIDKAQLRPAVQRSVSGSHGKFDAGRFKFDPVTALRAGRVVFPGDLDLNNTQITSLPAGLTVGGNLYLKFSKITSLPAGLTVGADLNLSNTKITSLPPGLKVNGSLDLSSTKITSLSAGLKVGGDLYLNNTSITSLPAGLKVGGLWISNTPITSLPAGLKVGGGLWLNNTPITSLPAGLKVGGSLNLRNTPITSLPAGLTVGGDLNLRNTPITSLPSGLKVSGEIYKDF